MIRRAERLAWVSAGYFLALYFALDALVIEQVVDEAWKPLARAGVLIVLSLTTLLLALQRFVGRYLCGVKVRQAAAESDARLARVEGVLLAARTAEHEINNRLALTVGYAELLLQDASLSEQQRAYAEEAHRGAHEAAALVQRLSNLQHVSELDWGSQVEPTINLEGGGEPRGAPST